MSKALIITVAGTSSRFRKSLGRDVLKAIYTEENSVSILDTLLDYAGDAFEDIVIVGGYQFEALETYIEDNCTSQNITLVYNDAFERGSNESLLCGIRALKKEYSEVLFAEGDLVVDRDSFSKIIYSNSNIITHTTLPIVAKTSVVYYFNLDNRLKYKYDTEHKALYIDEPFISVSNSGQIWKFADIKVLKEIANGFGKKDIDGTNLLTISAYFNAIDYHTIEQIQIQKWFNCNTIDDYRESAKYLHTKENNE